MLFRFVARNGFARFFWKLFCAKKVAIRKVLGFCASGDTPLADRFREFGFWLLPLELAIKLQQLNLKHPMYGKLCTVDGDGSQ